MEGTECALQPNHLLLFFFLPLDSSWARRLMADERERQDRGMGRRVKAHPPSVSFRGNGSFSRLCAERSLNSNHEGYKCV